MKPQRIGVLLNASSGTAKGKDRDTLRDALEKAFGEHAISARLEFLPGPELRAGAERALKQAAAGELDAVVAAGGDGTIRTVAGVLTDSGVPLGVIALGTLNHFAKDLKIPLAVEDAVAVIAAGATRAIDVGEVNGEIFVNNSSIGLYPYLVIGRERRREGRRLPKWFATMLAALQAFRNFPLRRLSIRAEGWTEACRSPCVFVGNNEYQLSGASLGTRERLDAATLCLYVARQQSAAALLWLACRSILGLLNQSRDLRTVVAPAVDISSHHRRLLVACDGEVETLRSPLQYRTRPAALHVFVPPPVGAG